ncbi:MAG: hypothetical protein ACJ777_05940, partial [Chloroflexota bacterium]
MANDERVSPLESAAAIAERSVTRRDLLKLAGFGAGMAVLAPIIAACSGNRASAGASGGAGAGASAVAGGSAAPAASGSAAAGGSGALAIQPPATAVKLDFWNPFTGGDGPFLKKIVDQFNGETPNVQVKF